MLHEGDGVLPAPAAGEAHPPHVRPLLCLHVVGQGLGNFDLRKVLGSFIGFSDCIRLGKLTARVSSNLAAAGVNSLASSTIVGWEVFGLRCRICGRALARLMKSPDSWGQ